MLECSLTGDGTVGLAGWARPHHDSGPSFTSTARPRLGDEVTLTVWVPRCFPVDQIAVRQVIDGEIAIGLLVPRDDDFGTTWTTTIVAANPVNRYRFCLTSADAPHPYLWLTAAGLSDHDVSDSTDFTLVCHDGPPAWVDDAVVYQIFPDRFARSARTYDLPAWAVPTAWDKTPELGGTAFEYYGGDLWGVLDHLDYIEALGANVIYLTPVFPAGSVHRYDASTFDAVDPLLGGDEALIALIRSAHERDIRVLLDLTTNHTGHTHEWFEAARADATSPEAGFYYFTDHPDAWLGWWDVASLPKLDHTDAGLRERLYASDSSVAARWLGEPFSIDGWRIDVANMTGRLGGTDVAHDVARAIRATMRRAGERTGRDTWLVAEHGHDATRDLLGDGWHGTMNYNGFTRPLWSWLSDPDNTVDWLGLPMFVPHLRGEQVLAALASYNAELPWPSRLASQNQLDSHDTPRFRSVTSSDDTFLVGVAALATLPGVPTVFSGDEFCHIGRNGEESRTAIDWGALADGVPATLAAFRAWLALRRAEVALRSGGLRWLGATADCLAFVRTHPSGDLLVMLARDAQGDVRVPLAALRASDATAILTLGGASARVDGADLVLAATSAGACVVRLVPGAR